MFSHVKSRLRGVPAIDPNHGPAKGRNEALGQPPAEYAFVTISDDGFRYKEKHPLYI